MDQCQRPMAATIATLLDLDWKPISPHQWLTPQQTVGDFMRQEGVSHFEVLHVIHEQLEEALWKNAAKAFGGEGLETGLPSFMPAGKAHRDLIKKGLASHAKALEYIITNKTWAGERLQHTKITDDPNNTKCIRCDQPDETRFHRYYSCKANDDIDNNIINKTKHISNRVKHCPEHSCLWYRGILPKSMIGHSTGWTPQSECEVVETGNFSEALEKKQNGRVGRRSGQIH